MWLSERYVIFISPAVIEMEPVTKADSKAAVMHMNTCLIEALVEKDKKRMFESNRERAEREEEEADIDLELTPEEVEAEKLLI